jgi:hypothetical protein
MPDAAQKLTRAAHVFLPLRRDLSDIHLDQFSLPFPLAERGDKTSTSSPTPHLGAAWLLYMCVAG